jgi:hypothetical protein
MSTQENINRMIYTIKAAVSEGYKVNEDLTLEQLAVDADRFLLKWATNKFVDVGMDSVSVESETDEAIACKVFIKCPHTLRSKYSIVWVPKSVIVDNSIPTSFSKKILQEAAASAGDNFGPDTKAIFVK